MKQELGLAPVAAVVFGSGLGTGWQASAKFSREIPYEKIPHFSGVAVKGHEGSLALSPGDNGRGISLLALHGRRHFYEGIPPWEVVFPIRVLAGWGVKHLILTNASGSLNPKLKPGKLVMLKDHINLMGMNPLIGPNMASQGPRFPSLQQLYQNPLSRRVKKLAGAAKVNLSQGVYVAISGPSYETPAEVKAYRKLGGDLVGMSTVPEAITATHGGMMVTALAAVTNSCIQPSGDPNHDAVLKNAQKVDRDLTKLLLRLQQEGIKS